MANLVIPRLTRRPVREADIQKFHRPPLISAAFSPMDAESSGSKLPCVTVFNDAGCRVGARHDEMAVFRAKFSRDNARSVRPLMRPSRVSPRLRPTRSCCRICAVIMKWRETSRRAAFSKISSTSRCRTFYPTFCRRSTEWRTFSSRGSSAASRTSRRSL